MNTPQLVRYDDAAVFATRATGWLVENEAANNLLLGILPSLVESPRPGNERTYLASIEANDEIVGCAFRTPPFHLGVTPMPAAALASLVADVAAVYPSLSGVIGPPTTARAVADTWVAAHGGTARLAMQQGIYELERVNFPTTMPRGATRIADPTDAPLLRSWAQAFVADTGIPAHDVHGLADRLVAERAMAIWEVDGEPCCMTGVNGPTPNGIRVSYVYTPPDKRGRGYASALVAHVSRAQLDHGKRFCFLYTDLTNPTSNRIYQKLGYRQVAESIEVKIEEEE